MVEQRSPALDRVFRALASEPRREILRRTAQRPWTVTELADLFDMSLAAVSKHIGVLDDARLLVQTRDGRLVWRRFNAEALEPAQTTLDELRVFWTRQLDGLERYLVRKTRSAPRPRKPRGKR
jgi:DNA-binding transcriptional ArsR family regulator